VSPLLSNRTGTSTPLRTKVPEITLLFWVVKLLTTGIGEAASDFLGAKSIPLAAAVGLVGFVVAMWWQLRTRAYSPAPYWFAVSMVAVFGTMAADGLHKFVGLPYGVTTVMYAIAVAVVFFLWHRSERTLSIHSIVTRRRETFYWSTVLATFALGTAAGDVAAFTLHLGYLASAVLFAAAILVPAIAWARRWLNPIAAFWCAYVLTRPLGASIADWLGKPRNLSGLGYGDGVVTVVGAVAIAAFVAYLVARHDSGPGFVAATAPAADLTREDAAPGGH
jgi:uncharacterized membrane-anchored protein